MAQMVEAGRFQRDCNQAVIALPILLLTALLLETDHSQRSAGNKNSRKRRLVKNNQRIQRIAVCRACAWHKSPIEWIDQTACQRTLEHNGPKTGFVFEI